MSAVAIRRATPADLPQIGPLAAQLVRQHHERDPGRFFMPDRVEEGYVWWFGRELQRDKAVLLVAEQGQAIVGYAYATLEERDFNQLLDAHAAVHDIVVGSHVRRAGVGRRLLTALIEVLEQLGAPRIVLHTMVDNLAAQALFRAVGFRATMFEMTRNAPGT
jgi:ribosomal protein S18 acetylase RimI-like enzyme